MFVYTYEVNVPQKVFRIEIVFFISTANPKSAILASAAPDKSTFCAE